MSSTEHPDLSPDPGPRPRQPRKRFVGKKAAESLRGGGTPDYTPASIEDTGSALQGALSPPK